MPAKKGIRFFFPNLCLLFLSFSFAFGSHPEVTNASRHDTSPSLSQLVATATPLHAATSGQKAPARRARAPFTSVKADSVAASPAGPLTGVTTLLNFDGQSAQDNRDLFGFAFVPPDTNGAVGATQFVQMVNVTIAVYDKKNGALQLGPAAIHSLWSGFGGLCEFGGGTPTFADGGDPVVLYDHLAGRWLVSQLQYNISFTDNAECVAISTSSDATGSYNRYEFDFGSNFPDYPKFAVWPDGYYNSINVFGPKSFLGAEACAFDRNAMLSGAAAAAICMQPASIVSSLLPSDLDGSTLPPAGSPNYYVGLADSTHLNFFRFHVDFGNPANASLNGPTLIPVAPFSELCGGSSCIPQPPTGEKVDALSDRVMFRLAYRNFGDHESLVVNHTVKGGPLGAVRWYELRNPSAPFVYQQSTLFDPFNNYWLGSIAMDKVGDIALGFSASSKNLFPSVYVAGRKASDAAGAMSGPLIVINGSGVQQTSFHRWGDYSSMSVDPANDCTFWYTNEYYATSGSFDWSTRIGSFKFNNCKADSH